MGETNNIIIKLMEDLLTEIDDLYYFSYNPNGWILGSEIITQLNEYYSPMAVNIEEDDNTLMGLPYVEDTINKQRIEIIK